MALELHEQASSDSSSTGSHSSSHEASDAGDFEFTSIEQAVWYSRKQSRSENEPGFVRHYARLVFL